MSQSKDRIISFTCGILAIILGFSAYNDLAAGAMAYDTTSVIIGFIKIIIAIILSFAFTIFKSKSTQ